MADRPPRGAPPPFLSSPTSPTRSPPPPTSPPPQIRPIYTSNAVTFSEPRPRYSAVNQPSDDAPTHETLGYEDDAALTSPNEANFRRKKSLVRPDRERIDPNHRQWYYRNHAAQMADGSGVIPSTTGNAPLRRGKSLLNREEDFPEGGHGLSRLRSRAATVRRRKEEPTPSSPSPPKAGLFSAIPGPKDAWVIYCYALTACFPPFLLNVMGIRSPEQQRAWREKMGLLSIIISLMAGVGFLTFGFTKAVCHSPATRYETGTIQKNYLIVHGYAYDLGKWKHPAVANVFTGKTNPLFDGNYNAGGMDASFMFQKVNQRCSGLITLSTGSSVSVDSKGNLGWYFPCNLYNQNGTTGPNLSGYDQSKQCHTTQQARTGFGKLPQNAQVYYSWGDVANPNRNLGVYESNVLDFSLLNWLDKAQVTYPPLFDQMKVKNETFHGKDLSMWFTRSDLKPLAACLQDIITVGFVDTQSIGCVASKVVLYVSLVFIIGVVSIKFFMAVMFGWFLSWRIGSFANETYQQRRARQRVIEDWTDNIHSNAPAAFRPTVRDPKLNPYSAGDKRKTIFFPTTSRFSQAPTPTSGPKARPNTMYRGAGTGASTPTGGGYGSKAFLGSPEYRDSRSSTSLNLDPSCPWPLARDVVPQPPPGYEPHNYPLSHTICLVTAYSESVEGLRTTLDSLATTDYSNSHKLLLVIADGMVKGSGNTMTTPEIVIGMMKDFVLLPEEVQAHSYVAIADGHKRHNMAKVYAGFYDYSDATVEPSKQQRVPMVLVAKVGNPLERDDPKPGNRGKRDSQIVLMSFLQKVMFDERMTTFEYEFFNSIWRVTGISPDRYEMVLCVDADTKVFPDSVARMVACMVHDEEIMGLCGETKIANKGETWVTMIQVFEYYISHHLTKAFESMFGGVTCLPGCFSMYRIKAPKGQEGFWVPILANPDIVEHYSENIVDTLHKKNLLLLGEDRYLTTLMLKTFPKRKMIFCPQAVCKTIVPDTFGVLLSQRRRWINSTVHNLAELLLVRDLCGTFCFSMQFVVFMELAGTLVLPAAISFTGFLIIDTVLPSTKEKPIIPLILLGIILGLPGLLIVVTSRKVEYVGWMLIYFLSLPIWNLVLPTYAFWHFDDFSWGQTRMVAGEKAGGNHGDKEGEFDSSHIVMKRWAEFERDRRFNPRGGHSRDSTYGMEYYGSRDSPKQRDSKRFSVVSSGEALADAYRPQLPSKDSYESEGSSGNGYHQQRRGDLMLPAPLAVGVRRNDDDQGSERRLIPSPQDYHSSPDEADVSSAAADSYQSYTSPTQINPAAVRHGQVSQGSYPGETQNPYRLSLPQMAAPSNFSDSPTATEEDHTLSQRAMRGVSLVDNGPVPSGERRVPRPSARRQSAKPQQVQTSFAQTTEDPARPPRSHRPPTGPPPGAASPLSPQQRWNDPRYQ